MDCGPTCLRMVARSYGKHYNADTLRQMAGFSKAGVSMLGISDTAEKIGLRTRGIKLNLKQLREAPLPAILHWNHNHFVVMTDIKRRSVMVADPAKGFITYTTAEFLKYWAAAKDEEGNDTGVALLLEPAPEFYESEGEKEHKLSWSLVSKYLLSTKW